MRYEKVINLAERRGFFYPSCEIYGGKAGFYDYGSLGTLLKRKFENLWRKYFLNLFDNIWEIEPCDIMHENVFRASRHLELFVDPVTECKKCKKRFRADKLIEEKLGIKAESLTLEEMTKIFKEKKVVCPECGGELSEARLFNLMFPIFVGPESGNFFAELNDALRILEIFKNVKKKKCFEGNKKQVAYLIKKYKDFYVIESKKGIWIFNEEFCVLIGNKILIWYDKEIGEEDEKIVNEVLKEKEKICFRKILKKIIEYYKEILENRMFLRPETAQGPYVNFPKEITIQRNKLPLGLAVIGKAYRNEISPRQALLRLREFTQAELQIFFDLEDWSDENFEKYFNWNEIKDKEMNILPVKYRNSGKDYITKTVEEWYNELKLPKFYLYFMYKIQEFYLNVLKIPKERFRFFELAENEKAFYNKYHFDVELYLDELGWVEVAGIHFRAIELKKEDLEKIKDKKVKEYLEKVLENKESVLVGYDLFNHLVLSGNVGFIITKDNKKILPVELELSFGVDRNIFALLWIFYHEEQVRNETRIVLKLPPYLAPIEVAVFPLVSNKEEIVKKALEVYEILRKAGFKVFYDDSGSIGKRYRRQDEIGTPYCITIDYQTLQDNTVTIRFRDTMEQIRVKIEELPEKLKELLEDPLSA